MRVLRVITSMDPATGGPCQGIRNSIPELDALGCASEVVCLDDPGADFIAAAEFPIHAIGESRGPWAKHPGLLPWLLDNLSRYDAVIIHGLWQYHSYAVTEAVGKFRRSNPTETMPRVFVMPHGMLDPWFQNEPSRRIKAWRNWLYWKLIEHRTIAQADGVLFTCQKELELARLPFRPYRPAKEFNVGYGVADPPVSGSTDDNRVSQRLSAARRPSVFAVSEPDSSQEGSRLANSGLCGGC